GGRSAKRLVWMVVAAGIVIALVGSAAFLLNSRSQASLSGTWIARMQRPGVKPNNLRFRLELTGTALTGTVEFPAGTGDIQNGLVQDNRISFTARHVQEQQTEPSTAYFTGELRGREIDLTATDRGVVTKGVARKAN
ncbi:MAG: hypothetical protein H7039_15990, partial [Bryobacteraceae bacterium]|nr:hypothetical protein [Bryobacteraceae bacterium]